MLGRQRGGTVNAIFPNHDTQTVVVWWGGWGRLLAAEEKGLGLPATPRGKGAVGGAPDEMLWVLGPVSAAPGARQA